MLIFGVKQEEIAAIEAIPVLPGWEVLRSLVARAISITPEEKAQIVRDFLTFSPRQLSELHRILTEECEQFVALNAKVTRAMDDATDTRFSVIN